jgi:hypothetical protein
MKNFIVTTSGTTVRTKRGIFILMMLLLGSVIFAQGTMIVVEETPAAAKQAESGQKVTKKLHRHNSFDMLLGINVGLGAGWSGNKLPDILWTDEVDVKKGDVNMAASVGLNYDLYFFHWLSISTGISLRPMLAVVLREDKIPFRLGDQADDSTVIIRNPVSLTFPLQFHINVPFAEWLYLGAGVNINIPVENFNLLSSLIKYDEGSAKRGVTFFSIPIDIGFDSIKPGKGGSRFFFRYERSYLDSLSFLDSDAIINTYGFIWQLHNFKLNHRRSGV